MQEQNSEVKVKRVIYGVESKPSFLQSLGFGFQHLFVLTGGLVVFPLVVGGAFGLNAAQIAAFIGVTWIAMGINTYLQAFLIGNRMPIVQGPSFSFIVPALVIASMTGGGTAGMAVYMGAVILGGITEAIIGYGRIIGYLKKLISPLTMGVVIMLIVLGLYKIDMDMAKGSPLMTIFILVVVLILSMIVGKKKPSFKLYSILIGIAIGYLICLTGKWTGIIKPESALYISFAGVAEAPWVTWPTPFRWGVPKFTLSAYLIILAGYISSIVESVGDYHAYAAVSDLPPPDKGKLNKGIGSEGIGSAISGIIGGPASTSYTENMGAIALTGVASRHVIGFAAAIVIILGFFRKFGALAATVPNPIIAGILSVAVALIIGAGIEQISKVDMHSSRNLLIIGLGLFLGLSIPYLMESMPIVITGAEWLANTLNGLLETPMAVGLIVCMVLDNILPGTKKERGLEV
jgi:nucleobase transporter 1/2